MEVGVPTLQFARRSSHWLLRSPPGQSQPARTDHFAQTLNSEDTWRRVYSGGTGPHFGKTNLKFGKTYSNFGQNYPNSENAGRAEGSWRGKRGLRRVFERFGGGTLFRRSRRRCPPIEALRSCGNGSWKQHFGLKRNLKRNF